jgi:hypothetical protein
MKTCQILNVLLYYVIRINSANSECHSFRLGCWLNPTLTNTQKYRRYFEKYRFFVFINCDMERKLERH